MEEETDGKGSAGGDPASLCRRRGSGIARPSGGIGEHGVELLRCSGEGGWIPRVLWDFGGAV